VIDRESARDIPEAQYDLALSAASILLKGADHDSYNDAKAGNSGQTHNNGRSDDESSRLSSRRQESSRRAAKTSNRGTDRRDRQDIEDHDLQY
jgi:hypothetical protein